MALAPGPVATDSPPTAVVELPFDALGQLDHFIKAGAVFHQVQHRQPIDDDEVAAEEDRQLAHPDDLVVVDVPRGLDDGEREVVVALELGSLVGLDGVLDG